MAERKCGRCQKPGHTIRTCKQGVVFRANFPGMCDKCLRPFEAGDWVRADGEGGYEGVACCHPGQIDPVQIPQPVSDLAPRRSCTCSPYDSGHQPKCPLMSDPTSTVEPMAETAIDQFFAPAAAVVEEPKQTISGQPEAERDSYGRYLMKDPRTGEYKTGYRGKPEGFTRATTFNKTLSDNFAINQWGKRNVAVGMTLRPDLLALADGLDVRQHSRELNKLCEQAAEAAGDKVAANLGTAVHSLTERLDAGLITLDQVPRNQLAELTAYADKVRESGLAFKQEWIERATMTSKVGEDVAGTMDRIGTLPNCENVIVDLKTGRDPLKFGDGEIAIQLLIYALGVNEFGLYDWNTNTWQKGPRVREDLALVIHLPVQRKAGEAAYCDFHWVNLADPDVMEAAKHSAWARKWRKKKGLSRPAAWDSAPTVPTAGPTWVQRFGAVETVAEAGTLWLEAKNSGVQGLELQRLVRIAQDKLAVQG